MKFGVLQNGWWKLACEKLGAVVVDLPEANHDGNAYAAGLEARAERGAACMTEDWLSGCQAMLDNGGTGLWFVLRQGTRDDFGLLHEQAGLPLCSHFIDPMPVALQGLDWPTAWSCLQSRTWLKAVWDRVQMQELQSFGVPGVFHMPMAAPVRAYNTAPLDASQCRYPVSFVGSQNSTFFQQGKSVECHALWPGALGQLVRGDLPDLPFYEVFYNLYELAEPPTPSDDVSTRAEKTKQYYSLKLVFHALLNLRNRDRFVLFLAKKLGDHFHLVGRHWRERYGLQTADPLPDGDPYFDHFRRTAININLVNGNAESGLNMRHYEVTAAGGFLLCYHQPELAEHFVVGEEVEVFHHEQELLEKIQYYLAHPERRAEIAAAGQRRTLTQHLYTHRLHRLLQVLKPATQGSAPADGVQPAKADDMPASAGATFPAAIQSRSG